MGTITAMSYTDYASVLAVLRTPQAEVTPRRPTAVRCPSVVPARSHSGKMLIYTFVSAAANVCRALELVAFAVCVYFDASRLTLRVLGFQYVASTPLLDATLACPLR